MTVQFCILTDYACIEVRGADAGTFLHAQLSQRLTDLPHDRAPLAAWHDARGRVRALVRVHRLADHWLLVTPADGAEQVLRKLRMFVLRSAVTLTLSTELAVGAVLGGDAAWLAQQGLHRDAAPATTFEQGGLRWTRVDADYWQVLGAPATLAALATLAAAAPNDVALTEIRLGLPLATARTFECFVAQMLNLDLLGALSFDKGCYPGQEIIARVHNLGTVKRRVRRFGAAGPISIGAAVTADGETVGEVLRTAATSSGCELLAVVDNAAAAALLASDGLPLRTLPLPFDVPRD